MKKSKIIIFSFLGLVAASFISIPIQTELSVRKAKKSIVAGISIERLSEEFGEPMLIKSEEKQRAYLSDTSLSVAEGQKLWVIGKEGFSYWNILIVTDSSDLIVAGDVDRLW